MVYLSVKTGDSSGSGMRMLWEDICQEFPEQGPALLRQGSMPEEQEGTVAEEEDGDG